jgi:hypothetical protein
VISTITRAGSPLDDQDAAEFHAHGDSDTQGIVEPVRRIGKVE